MKDLLYTTLNTIYPNKVFLQGTLASNAAYPDEFITFWTDTTSDNAHYNDDVTAIDWEFSVCYYTNNPADISTSVASIRTALKSAGFIPQGKGYDLPSDQPSHTGWAMDFIIRENITSN